MSISPIMDKQIKISQKYGNDLIINGKHLYAKFWFKWHEGCDFACPIGTVLYAWLTGEVTVKDTGKLWYWLHVMISKPTDTWSSWILYAHLSGTHLKTGDKITEGQLIGKSGNSGNSTAPHLHFSIRFRDKEWKVINYGNWYNGRENPIPYFVNGKYWNAK